MKLFEIPSRMPRWLREFFLPECRAGPCNRGVNEVFCMDNPHAIARVYAFAPF